MSDMITAFDVHVGTPDDVIASLRTDSTLERVTDLVFQVHSVDPRIRSFCDRSNWSRKKWRRPWAGQGTWRPKRRWQIEYDTGIVELKEDAG